jgi:L-asparaginase
MKIIIHGGFFSESSSQETKIAKQTALERIVKDSFQFLKTHSAVETVVYAVSLLEDDELFNAGMSTS